MLSGFTGKALTFNLKKNLCLEHCLVETQRRSYLCLLNETMIIYNTPGTLVGSSYILMSMTNIAFPQQPYLAYK